MVVHRVLAVIVAAAIVAGCGDDEPAAQPSPSTQSTSPASQEVTVQPDSTSEPPPLSPAPEQPSLQTTSPPTGPTTPGDAGAKDLPAVVAAVEDLASRLGVDPSEITVADARFVTWPDSSAGCPQPGMGYLQVLTDGVLVVLKASGGTYEYHSRGSAPLFLCSDPRPPLEG